MIIMRTLVFSSLLAVSLSASAADLRIAVDRNGFTGPIEMVLAPRVEGAPPQWSASKTMDAAESAATFTGLPEGLYLVLARGPQPLQRLSAKANVGSSGGALRLTLPKEKTSLRVTLAGRPVARAAVLFTEEELLWDTRLEAGGDGRFVGALWQPGAYTASVWPDRAAAPYVATVALSAEPLTIDVPDRLVTGRVVGEDGRPIAGAKVILRTQGEHLTQTAGTSSASDGRFEFFGVPEGAQALRAKAPSYLDSDVDSFELLGAPARHSHDLTLARGTQRTVRVVDQHSDPVGGAMLFAACDGHIKSTALTDEQGQVDVALPDAGGCSIYALPKEGSLAVAQVAGKGPLVVRVREGSSSLKLALKSESGQTFSDIWLLMSIDGTIVPPAVSRQLFTRGLRLMTNAEGSISLAHIPPGTYDFWPYRSEAEGQMLYDSAWVMDAPISLDVVSGENSATVRLRARR
jgi:Carboxypeptidase regulatory-like domain